MLLSLLLLLRNGLQTTSVVRAKPITYAKNVVDQVGYMVYVTYIQDGWDGVWFAIQIGIAITPGSQ